MLAGARAPFSAIAVHNDSARWPPAVRAQAPGDLPLDLLQEPCHGLSSGHWQAVRSTVATRNHACPWLGEYFPGFTPQPAAFSAPVVHVGLGRWAHMTQGPNGGNPQGAALGLGVLNWAVVQCHRATPCWGRVWMTGGRGRQKDRQTQRHTDGHRNFYIKSA